MSSDFMCQKGQIEKNNSGKELIRDLRLDNRFDWVGPPDDISKIRPIRFVLNNFLICKKFKQMKLLIVHQKLIGCL